MANLSSSNGLEKRPKLRFPGFDEPWKETTLSALFSKSTQKNADGHITNVICNSAKLGLIPQRKYFDKDIANSDNTSGYYIIRQNDFVYNPRKSSDAPYGPISSYKYAEDGIVSPLYLCFHAKDEINPLYYEWYFRSSAWHRYIYMSGDSGARHDRVSIKDDTFFAMPINLPSEQEQSKIASFLQNLDERIAAQEKLVASLKKYKRGVIKTTFDTLTPVSKSSIGKMATMFSGGTPRSDIVEYYNGSIPFIRSGEIHNDFTELHLSQIGLDNSSAKMVRKGDLLYALYGATSGEVDISKIDGAINQAILCIRTNEISSEYLALWLEINKNNILSKMLQGGQGNLSGELVKSLVVPIYSKTEEQVIVRIGNSINKLIDANTNMLYMLNKAKESLLQQMFI